MNSPVRTLYASLVTQLKEISCINGIQGLLSWDQEVMMPAGAAQSRGEQLSALAGIAHEKSTAPSLGALLKDLKSHPEFAQLNAYEQANVRDAWRSFEKESKVPKEISTKIAELSSRGTTVWAAAREENDFAKFSPILKEWVSLLNERCHHIDPTASPYQLLLDDYERGMKVEKIDQLFTRLKQGLVPLIAAIQKKPKPNSAFLDMKFPVETQVKLNHRIAKEIGFDTARGRLDVSVHPFTGGAGSSDVRMTTRYRDSDLVEGITGTIHETGHSIYEQGRNPDYEGLPVSEALSMGLHESQSLFWERMVGLGSAFWSKYWPIVQEHFPAIDKSVTSDEFYKSINTCSPGFIRIEADEATYPMHIIIRFEIEKGLFDGSIKVDDLPKVWNAKMKEYLGIVPETDKLGVLQDTHWGCGLFGYFPTYTIGAIYACQFYEAALKAMPNLESEIKAGNFGPLKLWLNENIHRKGSLYASGDELVKEVTGEVLNAEKFLKYLTDKYTKLYNL